MPLFRKHKRDVIAKYNKMLSDFIQKIEEESFS